MPKKTDAELTEELERRAEDAVAHTPVPKQTYMVGSLEFEEEQAEHDAQAEAITEDQLSNDKVMKRLVLLEEQYAENAKLMRLIAQRMGFLDDQPDTPDGKHAVNPQTPQINPDAKVRIFINPSEDPARNWPVPVGVNGSLRYLPRGEYIEVTQAELEVLRHAVVEGWHLPVGNDDNPMAPKPSRNQLALSQPVPYKQTRFPLMVG